jgi:GDP-4-dehydro-6-deoxy-D-mannose reductase
MKKEIIFLTGLNGSGASFYAEYLINNHPEVEIHGGIRWHSSSNLNNISHIKDKLNIHEMDLLDLSSIIRAFQISKPTKIVHLAAHANVSVAFKTPLAVVSNNFISTANLLEAIRIVCPDACLQIISTSEVYGSPKTYPIKEDFPLDPRNPYSVSKLASEHLAVSYFHCYGIKVIVLRSFSYINPRRRDLVASAFAMQVARIEVGLQDVVKHGYLESIRSFLDIRDMVRAYWVAFDKCEPATPYHIGGGQPIMVGMLLSILKYKATRPIIGIEDKSLLRPIDVVAQVPDVSKFYKQTGWTPKYTLDESMYWLLNECRKVVKNER